jgi:type II secretory pathway pseudopilin PulG
LIELAVVIGVVSVLLGALISPLVAQNKARQLRNERNAQVEIRDSLIGFAVVNRRLPCPDNDGDGTEDRTGGAGTACTAGADGSPDFGFLPWNNLGVRGIDTWGRLYLYRVDADFALESVPGTPAPDGAVLDLQDVSGINISNYNDSKATFALANGVAAIVVSLGANGHGGTDIDGNALAAVPAANANEVANVAGTVGGFISRQHTRELTTCDDTASSAGPLCEFDDVLTWVPPPLLFLRMVEGGALP